MSTHPPTHNNNHNGQTSLPADSGTGTVWSELRAVISEVSELSRVLLVLLLRVLIFTALFVAAVHFVVNVLYSHGGRAAPLKPRPPASGHTHGGINSGVNGETGAGHALAWRPASGRTVTAAVAPAALHTELASSASATSPTAVQPAAGRVGCRTERGHGGDRAVIGAGPVQISIDTDVADCADSHRARSRSRADNDDGDDRDCRCDRDRGRNRSSSRDRDPVVYLPADPSSDPGRGYPREAYPRESYSPGYRSGERPGHVCRQVRPGEHPDLPDGGLICIPADRAPAGW